MTNDSSAYANLTLAPSPGLQRYDILIHVIAHLIMSPCGIVANIFIIVVLRSHKDLQSPCLLLIAGESVFNVAFGLGTLLSQILKAYQVVTSVTPMYSRMSCFLLVGFPVAAVIQSIGLITLFISTDRLISIVFPTYYGRLGKRYAYTCVAVCAMYGVCATLGGLENDGRNGNFGLSATVACTGMFSGFGTHYIRYYGASNFTSATLSVCSYAVMRVAFILRRKKLAKKASSGNELNAFLQHQSAAMPVINLLMISYIITGALPEFLIVVASACAECTPYFSRISNYAGVIKGLSMLSEILALSVGSAQFRTCAKKLLRWK